VRACHPTGRCNVAPGCMRSGSVTCRADRWRTHCGFVVCPRLQGSVGARRNGRARFARMGASTEQDDGQEKVASGQAMVGQYVLHHCPVGTGFGCAVKSRKGAFSVAKKRVLVVVNKWWECDPIVNVLLHDNARPPALGWPDPLNHPRRRPDQKNLPPEDPSPVPRAVYNLKRTSAEVWCISDLLEHLPDRARYQSSTEVKARYLPRIFKGKLADLVIAVGTAAYPGQDSENGSVVAGSRIFIHNAHSNGENPDSDWDEGPFDEVIHSSISEDVFQETTAIVTSPQPSVMSRFLVPPLNAASAASLVAGHTMWGLGPLT
jgi:hypothetical protein